MRPLLCTSALMLALGGFTCQEGASAAQPNSSGAAHSGPSAQGPAPQAHVQVPAHVVLPSPSSSVRARLSLDVVGERAVAPGNPRLRIADTTRFTVVAKVEHLVGDGKLSLVIVSPDGNAYAVGAWLIADGDGTAVERSLTVPVRGTAIEDHDLSGRWSAELTLDGAPLATLSLELER